MYIYAMLIDAGVLCPTELTIHEDGIHD